MFVRREEQDYDNEKLIMIYGAVVRQNLDLSDLTHPRIAYTPSQIKRDG